MEEKQLTQQESMLIIQQMISTAKSEQKDDGISWIIWGWLLFFASIFTWGNLRFKWFESPYLFWNIFGLLTLVWLGYNIIRFFFFKSVKPVRTYTSDLFSKLNVGFFVSLMFIIVAINVGLSSVRGFSMLINLYAFWALIYGTALNFKPSIIGAALTWIIGFASFTASSFAEIMLFHSLAALTGYIIPGHIANREFRKVRIN